MENARNAQIIQEETVKDSRINLLNACQTLVKQTKFFLSMVLVDTVKNSKELTREREDVTSQNVDQEKNFCHLLNSKAALIIQELHLIADHADQTHAHSDKDF